MLDNDQISIAVIYGISYYHPLMAFYLPTFYFPFLVFIHQLLFLTFEKLI